MNPANETKLDAIRASRLRDIVFSEMLRSRPHKYKQWLRGMGAIRFLAILFGERIRAEIVVSLYAALHFVDDVVDGDALLPAQYSTTVEYVRSKIRYVTRPGAKKNDMEWLFGYSFDLAHKLGLNIEQEVRGVLVSMLFDATRRNPLAPQKVKKGLLRSNFHDLDIVHTIGLCLKIFKEAAVQHPDLRELGEASRIYYTLRDVAEDFRAGYCNIPLEDMERLGINAFAPASSAVQKWCVEEAGRGLQLLQEHRRKVKGLPLRMLTRIALPLLYERPARKFFNQVLRNK